MRRITFLEVEQQMGRPKKKHPIQLEIEQKIRAQGKSPATAEAYWGWVYRYLAFCKAREIGKDTLAEKAVELFLSQLANVEDISENTQNQAPQSKSSVESLPSVEYNDQQRLDWRLAVKVLLWVIMRGSYAAPILDRYANPHVLPSKIGVLGKSVCQGF